MLKALYSIGMLVVLNDGTQGTIKVPTKDFSKSCIKYRLVDGRMVDESDITSLADGTIPEPVQEPATPAKTVKLAPVTPAPVQNPVQSTDDNSAKIAAIDALTQEQLIKLIADRNLEIDAEDYSTREELAAAICEELDLI